MCLNDKRMYVELRTQFQFAFKNESIFFYNEKTNFTFILSFNEPSSSTFLDR